MRRVTRSRRGHVDLLRRRPEGGAWAPSSPGSDAVRRVDQLGVLVRLVERGVLSAEELERHEERVRARSADEGSRADPARPA